MLDAFIKLIRASESINNRLNRHLADVDLTISQFGILEALLHLGFGQKIYFFLFPKHLNHIIEEFNCLTGKEIDELSRLCKNWV